MEATAHKSCFLLADPGSNRGAGSDPVLREIVRRLVADRQPEHSYLFGSRARGNTEVDSDYGWQCGDQAAR